MLFPKGIFTKVTIFKNAASLKFPHNFLLDIWISVIPWEISWSRFSLASPRFSKQIFHICLRVNILTAIKLPSVFCQSGYDENEETQQEMLRVTLRSWHYEELQQNFRYKQEEIFFFFFKLIFWSTFWPFKSDFLIISDSTFWWY